jgi:hypothetical protein
MKDEKDKLERQTGAAAKNPRQDRLKLALRENLKRRKSQARGRSEIITVVGNDDVSPDGANGKKPGQ